MNRIAAAIALCVTIFAAAAADRPGIPVRGIGNTTCERFLELRAKDKIAEPVYMHWALGFMSGYNFAHIVARKPIIGLDRMPLEEEKAWLVNFCQKNPQRKYYFGVIDLFKHMAEKQGVSF